MDNRIKDRRLGERRPVRMPAVLVGEDESQINVLIIDLSHSGARIEIPWGTHVVPGTLLIAEKLEQRVEPVWGNDFEMGLRFLRPGEEVVHRKTQDVPKVEKLSLADLRRMANLKPDRK